MYGSMIHLYNKNKLFGAKVEKTSVNCILIIVRLIFTSQQGYFQLKANPGAWILRLRKGRSEDIYQILT